jgi:putative phosphoesterase
MGDILTYPTPLTIGVLSDTHVYEFGRRQVPSEVFALFRRAGVGLILHGGDINDRSLLTALEAVAPVLAVLGNNDSAELRATLPERVSFAVGPFQFVLIHGHQGRTARAVAHTFAGKADCVVYGHSHIPMIEEVEGTTMFNPGSPTDRRWRPHFGVGLIHLTAERCRPELILFPDPTHLNRIDVEPAAYTGPDNQGRRSNQRRRDDSRSNQSDAD